MKISLLIAYYKNSAALALILQALARQTYHNFEVVIAEDDHNPETVAYLQTAVAQFAFEIIHVRQTEDVGFRKNQILNKAVLAATGNYLVLIDGDCVPHPRFLATYATCARPREALFGRRVMVSETLTTKLLQTQNLGLLSLASLWQHGSRKLKYALYLPWLNYTNQTGMWGCNWGIAKQDLLAINGFDEDYIRAGVGEDVDVSWRLVTNGIIFRSVRFAAIVYHLHHRANYDNTDVQFNFGVLAQKKAAGHIFCVNGLIKPEK